MDGRTNRRNKATFSISPSVLRCVPEEPTNSGLILYAIRLLMTACVLCFTNWLTYEAYLRVRVYRKNPLDEHEKETCSLSGL